MSPWIRHVPASVFILTAAKHYSRRRRNCQVPDGKPEEEPDRKEYELVGEPMYRGLDGVTVLGAFLIKIVFGTNFFGKTLIPMDEYTGLDVTDEWLRYRRNNHWSRPTPAGDYIRNQAGHRHVMHADRITSGYVAPFSLNGTFEAFEPENAWAYALRNIFMMG